MKQRDPLGETPTDHAAERLFGTGELLELLGDPLPPALEAEVDLLLAELLATDRHARIFLDESVPVTELLDASESQNKGLTQVPPSQI